MCFVVRLTESAGECMEEGEQEGRAETNDQVAH